MFYHRDECAIFELSFRFISEPSSGLLLWIMVVMVALLARARYLRAILVWRSRASAIRVRILARASMTARGVGTIEADEDHE